MLTRGGGSSTRKDLLKIILFELQAKLKFKKIILSNGGANSIAEKTLDYYNSGLARIDITFKEMEDLIKTSAYNEGNI